VCALGALVLVVCTLPARAEAPVPPERPEKNLFGMTGLIDMPSAYMQPDGELTFTTSYFDGSMRNTLSAQFLPGIEAAFRYSTLDELEGGNTLYDRSFDVKLRLIHEGPLWPAVAVGLQDFLGTGVYSGEYVVATKSFLDGDLQVTGGVGWGRFAGVNTVDNPFCKLVNRLCDRERNTGRGGNVDIDSFFSGEDMGIFGGLRWRTPVDGLTLKAEYSSDDYEREETSGAFDRDIPLNFGLEYRLTDSIDVGAYYMYGSAVGVRLSLSGNPFRRAVQADGEAPPRPLLPRPEPDEGALARLFGEVRTLIGGQPARKSFGETGITEVKVTTVEGVRIADATLPALADYACPEEAARAIDAEYGVLDAVSFRHADGTAVCTVALRPAGEQAIRQTVRAATRYPTDWYQDPARRQEIVERLAEALDADAIGLFGIELEPERVAVYIENARYRAMPRAIGRTARALAATMPPSVALFEIVPVEDSLPTASVMLERAALERQAGRPDAAWDSWVSARVTDAAPADWSEVEGTMEQFPRLDYSINPTVPLNLFDPDQPVRADLSVNLRGQVELMPGLSLNGAVSKRLIGDLDDIERESDSVLPRVRSDIARYLREGDPGITRLSADYVTKLDEGLYGRVSAGYFEMMYGGIGGELLWKPAERDWGIGADINWVRQRDFDQLFGFRAYDVVTGHASLYWDTGFYGLNLQVDAGRYLAKDWGGTFTLKRRFANGWEIGGFFTLTDVSPNEFGEGSFDKGIFLTIPFNWFVPFDSRSSYSTVIRPLTRDGGQRLAIPDPLYPKVADIDRGGLGTGWGSFWE
jgi:hypothetical protein